MQGKKIHCVGIGGIGLSALAVLLKEQGAEVSGCDRSASPITEGLGHQGVGIEIGQSPEHVAPDLDLLIYSDAIPEDSPERARARELGIVEKSYFQALGEIANNAECLIAVAGAHGKTSTTAMLIDVLEAAELDPTAIVGSLRAKTKSNFRAGSNNYFVVEADEYMRHFLQFSPKILVITNIDADHLDYYQDLADIQSAFRELAQKVPTDGFIVCDLSDPNVRAVVQGLSCAVVDYRTHFDSELPMKVLPLQRINAAAVLAVAHILNIDESIAKKTLAEFSGTWRRFEYKGLTQTGAEVYDDYAHHPKEISATLASVREKFPNKKIIVAFQPHLYSRTKLLLDDFAQAFRGADAVVLAPIFAAREPNDPSISSEILAEKIREQGIAAEAHQAFDEVFSALKAKSEKLKAESLIITMGAGELYKLAERLAQ